MTDVTQAVNATPKYVEGLKLAYASTTTLTLGTGSCRDSTNAVDMVLDTGVTINGAVNGLNGLDTGSLANNTLYRVFLIFDVSRANPTGAIITASSTPYLPAGYGFYRLLHYVVTNGSAQFLPFTAKGNGTYRELYWKNSIAALTNGAATSLTSFTLANMVPPSEDAVAIITGSFAGATAGHTAMFAPFGSDGTVLPKLTCSVATVNSSAQLRIPVVLDSGVPKMLYINSAASGETDVQVDGFEYFI